MTLTLTLFSEVELLREEIEMCIKHLEFCVREPGAMV